MNRSLITSQSLDAFIQKKCTSLSKRLKAHPNKYRISVLVEGESKKPSGLVNSFKVTGLIKIARQGDLRVRKTGSDVKKTVAAVIEALETQIRRTTEKKERSRKTLGHSLKPVRSLKWEMNSSSK